MSKNTKIIAIVGGVLILGVVAYMLFTGGSAMDAMGCGAKKDKKARATYSKADVEWQGCRKYSFVPTVEEKKVKGKKTPVFAIKMAGKRKAEPKGGDLKKATCDCLELWKSKCASGDKDKKGKTFKDKNGKYCEQKAKTAAKKGCGDEEEDSE